MIDLTPKTIAFPFIDEVAEPLIRLIGVGVEVRSDMSYYFDNENREIDSYLFQYTLEGSGIFETSNKKIVMNPGHAFFTYIPSDTKYYCNPEDSHWKFIFVLFMGDHLRPYYDKVCEVRGSVFQLDEDDEVTKSAVDIYQNANRGLLNNTLLASSATFDFLTQLCCKKDVIDSYCYLNRQAIDLLESRYADISGIAEVADILGVSQSHLTRVFSSEVKTTPLEYLTKKRISHALRLLVDTNYSTDMIAHLCGYNNGNYFGKVFKKYVRTTPNKYRETRRL